MSGWVDSTEKDIADDFEKKACVGEAAPADGSDDGSDEGAFEDAKEPSADYSNTDREVSSAHRNEIAAVAFKETAAAAAAEEEELALKDEYVEIEKDITTAIAAKDLGNDLYRSGDYDAALEEYSRAITYCPTDDEHKEILATMYGNRAAAYFSLEEWELVVEDCTEALQRKDRYVKVIARRMQAYEKLEKYEEALTGATAARVVVNNAVIITIVTTNSAAYFQIRMNESTFKFSTASYTALHLYVYASFLLRV